MKDDESQLWAEEMRHQAAYDTEFPFNAIGTMEIGTTMPVHVDNQGIYRERHGKKVVGFISHQLMTPEEMVETLRRRNEIPLPRGFLLNQPG